MLLNVVLACLAVLSLCLLLWQWLAALRFPLHQRAAKTSFAPGITLLKPLKGCETTAPDCLRSWFAQDYGGPIQILFGVASADDPVCPVVRQLMAEFPSRNAQLLICGPLLGSNLKVSKLVQLEKLAEHELLIISDADVLVPLDLLAHIVSPLQDPAIGLVNCFYRLANPANLAMHLEAIAVNADFWSQVLQAQSMKPLDFALGAVMATRKQLIAAMGGFEILADCLADDYQLGHRITRTGYHIILSPVTAECWSDPMTAGQVWKHQLRWARTIRVCQPVPYFFSILSNATLWPLLWAAVFPSVFSATVAAASLFARLSCAFDLQRRLAQKSPPLAVAWLPPIKDLLQTLIWLLAFTGNKIEWRGETMRLRRDGTLVREGAGAAQTSRPGKAALSSY